MSRTKVVGLVSASAGPDRAEPGMHEISGLAYLFDPPFLHVLIPSILNASIR